jgi:hypothetical protein
MQEILSFIHSSWHGFRKKHFAEMNLTLAFGLIVLRQDETYSQNEDSCSWPPLPVQGCPYNI